MNIIIITGKLKDDIAIKNNVVVGSIVCDGNFFDIVAFGKKVEEVKDFKKGQLVIAQGELTKRKFNDKYYYKIVINNMELFGDKNEPKIDVLDNSEIIEDNISGIDVPDDQLPF